MTVELPKIQIHKCRVQKKRQPFRECHWQPAAADVEIVKVILEPDQRRFYLV